MAESPAVPPATAVSIVRNVLQGLQSLLELHTGQASVHVPRACLAHWARQLRAVLAPARGTAIMTDCGVVLYVTTPRAGPYPALSPQGDTMTNDLLYVASSWRNPLYDGVIQVLKAAKVPHYDFKHPSSGSDGFHWHDIMPNWERWEARVYREALRHPLACQGFKADMDALEACARLLLVLPCGRSAHLELGHAIGAGKETIIYYPEMVQIEPELMYKAATHLCVTMGEVLARLGVRN
jgi:hypothetical protein